MNFTKTFRDAAFFPALITLLTLVGCGAPAFSAPETPPANPGVASVQNFETNLSLPTPVPTIEPTETATLVISEYPPTATPSATPTFVPTDTPLPPATSVPTESRSPTLQPVKSSADIEHVVILSIDGLRPDALDQADTPVLDGLRAAGAYHPAAQAVLPSVTLVNHASMLGGMRPEKHGIDWNLYDPERGKVNGPTLFTVARDYGFTAAMVVGKPKLEHLVLPGSVDSYIYAGFLDMQVTDRAVEVIQAGLPDILFIHFPDVDSAGHASGWMSAIQLVAVGQTDAQVGQVLEALQAGQYLDKTLLLITSDHGGVGKTHGADSPEEVTVPWLAVGPGVPVGITLTGNIMMYDTAATVLYALNMPIPSAWDGQPVLEIFNK